MEKEKKSVSKKIFIFLMILVLLGAGVFAGVYYGLNKNNSEKEEVVEETFYELGEIFVNLSDDGGKKYVKLTATVTYNSKNKDLAEELEVKNASVRDAAIFYIKSCKADDFKSENELILKKNLVESLNRTLTTGVILDVKFNELLIQ